MRTQAIVLWATALLMTTAVAAGEAAKPEKAASPPPLPLHTIEGTSGVFITDTAYFANLPDGDAVMGKPSFSFSGVKLGHKNLWSVGVTTNFFRRLEVGYSFMRLGLGDWPSDVRRATGLGTRSSVGMHTLSARYMLVREGDWDLPCVPAVTAGVRYKHNEDIWDIDADLIGTCGNIGVRDNDGFEGTLTASKTFVGVLPRPFILSAGARLTDAAQIGLLGFTRHYQVVFEGNAIFFVTDRLLVAAEYRQKPDKLDRCLNLVGAEHDWWTLAAAYIVSDHMTVSGGYGHFGNILNHEENAVWALQAKWEF
jgi:hypothetical protein